MLDKIETLPLILLENDVILPNNELTIRLIDNESINAVKASRKNLLDNILIFYKDKDGKVSEYGTHAKINHSRKLEEKHYIIDVKTIKRVKNISTTLEEEGFYSMDFEMVETIFDDYNREVELIKTLLSTVTKSHTDIEFAKLPQLVNSISGGVSSETLVDLIVSNIKMPLQKKYKYLSIKSVNIRLETLIQDIKELSESLNKDNNTKQKLTKQEFDAKNHYFKQRMKALNNDMNKDKSDVEELKEALKKVKLPKDVEKRALKELNRYEMMGPNTQESHVIRQYLDFIIELPWNNLSKDNDKLKDVKQQLDNRHFGLNKVKDRIVEYLAVKTMTKKNPPTILCLAGPPGVGKTSLAKSIAEALGRKFVKSSLGGVKDESEIRGHRRTYVGALPGRILSGMKDAGTKNPVFLLDEIDKMSSDYKGDPSSAMLEVLDPEQNTHFKDHYLSEEFDLSNVMFIATANYLQGIPEALRDRMEIIQLSSYTETEKFHIALNHLVTRQLDKHGLEHEKFDITDNAILDIIRSYTREAGVRDLERKIGQIIRKSIVNILLNGEKDVHITEDNLTEYLDKKAYKHNLIRETNHYGIVTGLAYTAFGGDTLNVEVTTFKGKGGLVLTGKLGEVMQESAKTALSFVKSNADALKIDPKLFSENDIHIHVPEGATPKDGPSAGVTMISALVSAFIKKPSNKYIGMTGETTLHGNVLPIGGLKEKAIAAHRTGLKTIFIPYENSKDIIDIPEEVASKLEIIPVKHVSEILKKLFI